ncbi:hypothetical protein [uncultured Fusobacterium sp.]|nr:hypothetical protein [uncultured Fusobacterium sp.]
MKETVDFIINTLLIELIIQVITGVVASVICKHFDKKINIVKFKI